MQEKHPKSLWILVVGGAGFIAGFFGPMILQPEANQGPLVGILITGPGGALLGALGWGICSLFKISPRRQWQTLVTSSALLVTGTLISALPGPVLMGYVIEAKVERCRPVVEATNDVIEYWKKRIANVNWAEPRQGWSEQMTEALKKDHGVIIDVILSRRAEIRERKKPWNRGQLFAVEKTPGEKIAYYLADIGCDRYPSESKISGFYPYDMSVLKNRTAWPPEAVSAFIHATALQPTPAQYNSL